MFRLEQVQKWVKYPKAAGSKIRSRRTEPESGPKSLSPSPSLSLSLLFAYVFAQISLVLELETPTPSNAFRFIKLETKN